MERIHIYFYFSFAGQVEETDRSFEFVQASMDFSNRKGLVVVET